MQRANTCISIPLVQREYSPAGKYVSNVWGYLSSKVHIVRRGTLEIICIPLVWRVWQVGNSKVGPCKEDWPEKEDT